MALARIIRNGAKRSKNNLFSYAIAATNEKSTELLFSRRYFSDDYDTKEIIKRKREKERYRPQRRQINFESLYETSANTRDHIKVDTTTGEYSSLGKWYTISEEDYKRFGL